jgi:hypothetical protein
MSETQPSPDETTTQPTTPTGTLPHQEEMESISLSLRSRFRSDYNIVSAATVHVSFTSAQVRFRELLQPLDVQACPELAPLTKHGLEKNWQFAELTQTRFADMVPDRRCREKIKLFMAHQHGFFVETEFTEEMLRTLAQPSR